jgi:hypothetical protein
VAIRCIGLPLVLCNMRCWCIHINNHNRIWRCMNSSRRKIATFRWWNNIGLDFIWVAEYCLIWKEIYTSRMKQIVTNIVFTCYRNNNIHVYFRKGHLIRSSYCIHMYFTIEHGHTFMNNNIHNISNINRKK